MRRVTRRFIVALAVIIVALLALGAVPGLVRWGTPYHLAATPTENRTSIDATDLPERRFPYTTAALRNASGNRSGQSGPYWRGPVGLKEAFTHSPFDEVAALSGRNPDATAGDAVFARVNGTVYRLEVTGEGAA